MAKKQNSAVSEAVDESVCPECGGVGFLVDERGARPCKCRGTQVAQTRLRQAQIPPRFLGKTLRSFQITRSPERRHIRECAENYVKSFTPRTLNPEEVSSNGLLLIGTVGSGKTHIAVAILREVIERGFTGRYWNIVDLLDELRASYDPSSPAAAWEIMEEIEGADLLVLDDLGAEAPTGWVHDRLYQIINRRYEDNRPTIVTTNLELRDLADQIGSRITSRLCEMCMHVPFPNVDWRRKRMMENS
jgi:DNA replication protein DnaC